MTEVYGKITCTCGKEIVASGWNTSFNNVWIIRHYDHTIILSFDEFRSIFYPSG